VAQLVEALRYKAKGRGFDSRRPVYRADKLITFMCQLIEIREPQTRGNLRAFCRQKVIVGNWSNCSYCFPPCSLLPAGEKKNLIELKTVTVKYFIICARRLERKIQD